MVPGHCWVKLNNILTTSQEIAYACWDVVFSLLFKKLNILKFLCFAENQLFSIKKIKFYYA